MGDKGFKYLAAAVQMEPVWMDRKATTDKVCSKIIELGKSGVRLIVFPEVIIPGTPHWNWIEPSNNDLFVDLFLNAVEVPSESLRQVGLACRAANAYVILGIHEREGKSLYNTIVFINNEGRLIGKHRKLMGTHSEKLLWAAGDASGLNVYETPLGKLGGLICGEHNMSLARHALAVQGEEVHAAVWISGSARRGELYNRWVETWCCSYALANQTFVVSAQSVASEKEIKRFNLLGPGGGSSIVAPDGLYIAEPVMGCEADIIAEIDYTRGIRNYALFDNIRYHGRPDLFEFKVNREKQIPEFPHTKLATEEWIDLTERKSF